MEVRLVSGVADPLDWALRAIRKAHAKGLQLWVAVDRDRWPQLWQHLSATDPLAFWPVAAPDAPNAVHRRSRIRFHWADAAAEPPPGTHLLNLASTVHPSAGQFLAVVDCVPANDADAHAGRQRYRQYQQMQLRVLHNREGA